MPYDTEDIAPSWSSPSKQRYGSMIRSMIYDYVSSEVGWTWSPDPSLHILNQYVVDFRVDNALPVDIHLLNKCFYAEVSTMELSATIFFENEKTSNITDPHLVFGSSAVFMPRAMSIPNPTVGAEDFVLRVCPRLTHLKIFHAFIPLHVVQSKIMFPMSVTDWSVAEGRCSGWYPLQQVVDFIVEHATGLWRPHTIPRIPTYPKRNKPLALPAPMQLRTIQIAVCSSEDLRDGSILDRDDLNECSVIPYPFYLGGLQLVRKDQGKRVDHYNSAIPDYDGTMKHFVHHRVRPLGLFLYTNGQRRDHWSMTSDEVEKGFAPCLGIRPGSALTFTTPGTDDDMLIGGIKQWRTWLVKLNGDIVEV
ncbi:hypothetical protein N0V90_007740 [Kalmusia sp. IMI 367209]|nr:hypothetical protein N0V90_007740 [Kalmusia sp. IMI 367209]